MLEFIALNAYNIAIFAGILAIIGALIVVWSQTPNSAKNADVIGCCMILTCMITLGVLGDESVARPEKFEKLDDVIFVDSGQAGIIDYDHFEHIKSDEITDERWYESIHTFGTTRCPMTAHEQRIANALRQRAQDVLDFKTTADTSEMMSHYIQLMELKAHARDTARQYGVDARSLVDGKAEKYHYKIWNDRYSTISGTGLGDGVYPCFVAKDGNEVIGIRIDYLYESEDN